MNRNVPEKLRRFYDQFSGTDHVLIVINADPDAIASAMAISRLLWRKVLNVTVSHINTINRPDNLAMIRLLGVTMVPFNSTEWFLWTPSRITMNSWLRSGLMLLSTTTRIPAPKQPIWIFDPITAPPPVF